MPNPQSTHPAEPLRGILDGVHRRWRLRTVLRGLAILIAAAVAIVLVGGPVLSRFQFSPGAVQSVRWMGYLVLAGIAVRYLLIPLLRRPSSQDIALYLEEHEPALNARVLSALEISEGPDTPQLHRALVRQAVEACRDVDNGLRIEERAIRRSWGILAGAAVIALVALALGPRSIRHGATALALPNRSAEEVSPFSLDVQPGDATIARASDQAVEARSVGFEAETIELYLRPAGSDAEYQRLPMFPDGEGSHEVLVLDLQEDTEYFARSGRVRSPVFTIRVEDLPYVESLTLEYVFPDYTGLEPVLEEDGGDVAALTGTTIRLQADPTLPSPGGVIVLWSEAAANTGEGAGGSSVEDTRGSPAADAHERRREIPLIPDADGRLAGSFVVEGDGGYAILLQAPDGRLVEGSPEYVIDALADQPPTVEFTEPGRDQSATSIEEVFLEARARDDYGVGPLDLRFSVNGGEEQEIRLMNPGAAPRREVTASHTLYLEEYELEPGDLVSYYARTSDRGTGQVVESDLYFIQIQPFRTDVRQADAGGPPQGGQMGGGPESALTERQRQITVGTFNLIRDRDGLSVEDVEGARDVLLESQGDVREETMGAAAQARGVMGMGGGENAAGASIPVLLEEAVVAMGEASTALAADSLRTALRAEQRALQKLQAATDVLAEIQVAQGSGAGGGGAGGQNSEILDRLELDSSEMRNQYESVRRGERQEVDQEIDETLERLKELARRQEQEAERQRRMGEGSGSASAGDRQRQLADEAEEAARQLERLSRESGNRDLMESARRLQDAARSMRRSAAGQGTGGSEAEAALDQLREAERDLDRARGDRLEEDARDALRRIQELQNQQSRVSNEVEGLDELGSAGLREERARRLMDQKQEMLDEVTDLEDTLDRLASRGREEQPRAARSLEAAADGIRDEKLKEKLLYSQGLIQERSGASAARFEEEIQGDLEALGERVEEALGSFEDPREDRLGEVARDARSLVRGLESMQERGDEAEDAQDGEPSEQSQAGEPSGRNQGEEPSGQNQGRGSGQPGVGAPGIGAGEANTPFDPEQVRQMRGEARQRAGQARELQERLEEEGFDASGMDGLIENLQALENAGLYGNREAVTRLQAEVLEEARRFEFALRRAMQLDGEGPPSLAGNEDVPPGYRALVEEYFRSLSEGRRETPPPGGQR